MNLNFEVQGCSFPTFFSATKKHFYHVLPNWNCIISIILLTFMFGFFVCVEKDSYVLCRVFHKNNIGPPNSHRYAPFIEEEWDDSAPVLFLGEQAGKEVVAVHNPCDVEAGYDAYAEEAGHDECDEDAGNVVCAEENGRYEYVENGYVECVENRQDSFIEGNNFEQVGYFSNFDSFILFYFFDK